jgi:hypothetical protein
MYVKEINIEGLKALYCSDTAAKPVLEYFTTCKPDENVVTVDDLQSFFLKKRNDITRQDVINLFKDLETLGVGDFKIGRRTQKTRFVSKISLVSVGQAVVDVNKTEEVNQANQELEKAHREPEQDIEVVREPENSRDLGIKELSAANQERAEKFLTHSFPLRPNLVISLNLPLDLTDSEAERLSGFIKTLPFSR